MRIWGVVVGMVILLLTTAFMVVQQMASVHQRDLADYLTSVLSTTEAGLDSWYDQVEGEMAVIAQHRPVTEAAQRLLQAQDRSQQALLAHPAQAELRQWYAQLMPSLGYRGYFIIAPDGWNLASSRDANVGVSSLLYDQPGLLQRVLKGETLISPPQFSDVPLKDERGVLQSDAPTMFVATPLRGADGSIIGVLTARLDPVRHLFPILRRARVGNTGEAYIFNRAGELLSETRFEQELRASGRLAVGENAFGRVRIRVPSTEGAAVEVMTQAAMSASQGGAGINLEGYPDYRGVSVVGSWRWLKRQGYGLAVEIDAAESAEALNTGRGFILILSVFACALITGFGLFSVRHYRRLDERVLLRTEALEQEKQALHEEVVRRAEAEGQIALLLRSAGEGIMAVNDGGMITLANAVAAETLGYPEQELVGVSIGSIFFQASTFGGAGLSGREAKAQMLAEGDSGKARARFRTQDDSLIPVEYSASPLEGEDMGQSMVVIFRDISERQAVESSMQLADEMFEHMGEGVVVTDAYGRIVRANPAMCGMTGYSLKELIGSEPRLYSSGLQSREFYEGFWQTLMNDGYWEGEIINRHRTGAAFTVWETVSAIHDSEGRITHYVSVARDITDQKYAQEQIQRLAYYDTLTELPNRDLFSDRLHHGIGMAQRMRSRLAVMFLDLDGFKHVNDTFGHPMGDHLLRAVGLRLRQVLRDSDTIARLGGDEFGILLEDIGTQEGAAWVAQKLLKMLADPFAIQGEELHVGTSIGISFFPHDGKDPVTLLKNADAAMYRAKELGRGNYQFFDQQLAEVSGERLELDSRLRRALNQGDLELHFQPQVDSSGNMLSMEALVRWEDPDWGTMSPGHFLPLAEETGLIIPLGEWVLDQACAQMRRWVDQGAGIRHVAVNISGPQISRGNLRKQVFDALKRHELPARYLELEITEAFFVDHPDITCRVLDELRESGVRIAIDDFGSGHSSLAALKRLPVDTLKIGREFVRDCLHDPQDSAIIRAIVALGKAMDLQIIAEGVESEAQSRFLIGAGCDVLQGFLFSPPYPADTWLRPGIGLQH